MSTYILLTGSNQGLGHCVAQQLLVQGKSLYIYAACRTLEKAKENAKKLTATPEAHPSNHVEPVVIDLTDDATIEEAASSIPRLDILVNNAGIYVGEDFSSPKTIRKSFYDTYNTNLFGSITLCATFLPKLQEAAESSKHRRPALVNVSSGLSSFANMTTKGSAQYHSNEIVYSSSKTALNAYTVWASKKYPEVRVVAVAPGHSSTALNDFTGRQTAEIGAQYITNTILDDQGASGIFLEKGEEHAW